MGDDDSSTSECAMWPTTALPLAGSDGELLDETASLATLGDDADADATVVGLYYGD